LPSEPLWLSIEQIVEINQFAVEATGEPFYVRDMGLLEMAQAKPVNHWHYGQHDIAALSVQVLFGIAKAHAFEQGNKRTGFIASVAFLNINDYDLIAPDSVNMADAIVDVIKNPGLEAKFTDIWRAGVIPISG
jgi:death on curing protein